MKINVWVNCDSVVVITEILCCSCHIHLSIMLSTQHCNNLSINFPQRLPHIYTCRFLTVSFCVISLLIIFNNKNINKSFIKRVYTITVFFINFGDQESIVAQSYVLQVRKCGKSEELYPSALKISKQMSYADKRGAKFVVMVGEEEIKTNTLTIKNMNTGTQTSTTISQFIKLLNK